MPGSDSTQIVPLCLSMILLQMYRTAKEILKKINIYESGAHKCIYRELSKILTNKKMLENYSISRNLLDLGHDQIVTFEENGFKIAITEKIDPKALKLMKIQFEEQCNLKMDLKGCDKYLKIILNQTI